MNFSAQNPDYPTQDPDYPDQDPSQPSEASFTVVQTLFRRQLDTSMLFLSTDMPDSFSIQKDARYQLNLTLPLSVAGATGPVRPFISKLTGIWLPPPFKVVSLPHLGPNVVTATFIVQASETGNFKDLVSVPSRGTTLFFGKVEYLETPLTITFSEIADEEDPDDKVENNI